MKCRHLFVSFLVVCLLGTTISVAGVPDPARSGCDFPGVLPCPGPVPVYITVRDAFDIPVTACSTDVTIVLLSGSLDPQQQLRVTAFTNAAGIADLTFPDGIFGTASIALAITTRCTGNIGMCTSPTYAVNCSDPTPVDDLRWGRIKALYR